MFDACPHTTPAERRRRFMPVAAAAVLGLAAIISPGLAQDGKKGAAPAAKGAAPAADKSKDAAGQKQSAWVKLCEKVAFNTKDKEGKEAKNERNICLTHHERLDGNTGMVLVSAALRQVDNAEKRHFMVMVPLGMAIPPGMKAAVYTKEQWAAAAKNEKVDEKTLKPIDLKYTLCHAAGCTAETEATPEFIEQMKKGGGIMVLAINAAGQPIGFPVPLDGFPETYAGPPVDNKEYAKARSQLMAQIRQRQMELAETFKKEQEELQKKKAAEGAKEGAPAAKGAPAQKK